MATPFSHAIVAIAIGRVVQPKQAPWWHWALGALLSFVPDLDVIGFHFGVRYGDFSRWGSVRSGKSLSISAHRSVNQCTKRGNRPKEKGLASPQVLSLQLVEGREPSSKFAQRQRETLAVGGRPWRSASPPGYERPLRQNLKRPDGRQPWATLHRSTNSVKSW
jgi:hypothetical protein